MRTRGIRRLSWSSRRQIILAAKSKTADSEESAEIADIGSRRHSKGSIKNPLVELLRRYSKPEYQGSQLRRLVELTKYVGKGQARTVTPLPQPHRVSRRLSTETIDELVQAYRDGVGTPELRRRYQLSQGSVLRLLKTHGVTMRRQGLSDHDLPAATTLYEGGSSLSEIGDRFGISHSAVRRALIAHGVVMRPEGGSRPRK